MKNNDNGAQLNYLIELSHENQEQFRFSEEKGYYIRNYNDSTIKRLGRDVEEVEKKLKEIFEKKHNEPVSIKKKLMDINSNKVNKKEDIKNRNVKQKER